MNYNDLKKDYDNARREQVNADKNIRRIEKDLNGIEDEERETIAAFQRELSNSKGVALNKYVNDLIKPKEDIIHKKEFELRNMEEEYSRRMSNNTVEKLMDKCSSKQEIIEEVREMSGVLQERLEVVLGEQLYGVLNEMLDNSNINLSNVGTDQLINYFNRSTKVLENYKYQEPLEIFLCKLEDIVCSGKEETKKLTIALAVVMLVLFIFFFDYASVFYTITLTFLLIYYLIRSYRVFNIAVIQKAAKDNIDGIEEELRKQVEEEVVKNEKVLRDKYEPMISEHKEEIQRLKTDVEETAATAGSTFVFDSTEINNRKNAALTAIANRKSSLLSEKSNLTAILQEKTNRVTLLGKQLGEMLDGLQEQYLFGIGKAVIFEPQFLIDIDTKKSKPEYFVHPEAPCLFIYDNRSEIVNFIRLLSVQLRAKINPFNLSITVVDTTNMGNDFVYFTESDNSSNVNSFYCLVINEDGEKEMIKHEMKSLLKKQGSIMRGFENIREYNLKMVELNSLAEAYKFIFMLDPSDSLVRNVDMIRIVKNGATFGIFTHIFIEMDTFKESKVAEEVLDMVDKVYLVENDNLLERAKLFVKEEILQLIEEEPQN